MSEQPTREMIEAALRFTLVYRSPNDHNAIEWAARQYLASLDASAPSSQGSVSLGPMIGDTNADTGSPKDGTREPQPHGGGGGDRSRSERLIISYTIPPVPQEGVSEEFAATLRRLTVNEDIDAACDLLEEMHRKLAPLLEENARLREKLEQVAEIGDEAFDGREKAVARVKELEGKLLGQEAQAVDDDNEIKFQKKQVKELEAKLAPLLEENARLRIRASTPVPQEGVKMGDIEFDTAMYTADQVDARLAPLLEENARLRDERNQFMEQASLRDHRDRDMQEIMRINNELLARVKELEPMGEHASALFDENMRLQARVKELEGVLRHIESSIQDQDDVGARAMIRTALSKAEEGKPTP